MKKLLFLGACLVALASQPVKAQMGGPDVVVVTVRDINLGRVRVVLAYSGGRREEQVFKDAYTDKSQDEYTTEWQNLLAKLYQQGYMLKSTFAPGASNLATLIFTKGQ